MSIGSYPDLAQVLGGAAAAPAGMTRTGLPVGVQIVGPYLEDRTAIDVARQFERILGGYRAPSLI
jgi:amidase